MAYRSRFQSLAVAATAVWLLASMLLTGCDGSRPFATPMPPSPSPPATGSEDSPPGIAEPTAATESFADIDAAFDQLAIDLADPDFPQSDAVTLADLLIRAEDADLLMDEARAQRISAVLGLVAAAEDPDPQWLLTETRVARSDGGFGSIGTAAEDDIDIDPDSEASPGIVVATPGSSFVLDYARIDDEGETSGALTLSGRSRLRFEVRVQRGDDLIEVPEGDARASIVDWHPTIPQRVVLNIPNDLDFGRVAFALRPSLPDPGQQATAERWSSVFSAEVWNLTPNARQVDPDTVLLPLDASLTGADSVAFDDAFISERVQHWLEVEQTPIFVMVVNSDAFAVDDLLAHVLPNGLPYGGRVLEMHEDMASSQRLLLLEPDLTAVWQMAEAGGDYFVEQGLMPETVAFRIGPALPDENAALSSSAGLPRLRQAIDAQQGPAGLKFGDLFKLECDKGETTLTLSPQVKLLEGEFSVDFQAVAFGTSVFCKVTTNPAVGSKLGKAFAAAGGPATLLFKALFGSGIEASPYGEVKLGLESPSFSRFGVEASYSTSKGADKKLILPTALSTLGEDGEGLLGTPLAFKGTLAGELGVMAKASLLNPDGGFIGFLVKKWGKGDAVPEISVTLKGGPAAALGFDAFNAAAAHQLDENTQASLKLLIFAKIEPSDVFTKVARFLGARRDFNLSLKLPLIDIKSPLNFEPSGVIDDGAGSASFVVDRAQSLLSQLLPGGSTGRLARETSTVFNRPNDAVSYAVPECGIADSGRIQSPFVGCALGFFCSTSPTPVQFCVPTSPEGPDDAEPPPEDLPPPPVAVSDQYTMAKNDTLMVSVGQGVLANDTFIASDKAVLFLPPSMGTLVDFGEAGDFTYVPPTGFSGSVEFDYRIEGNAAGTARLSNFAIVTIKVVNDRPLALDDSFELPPGSNTLVVPAPGVLANDSDPNNDPLTAVVVEGPFVGELSLNADGGFTYVAPDGFAGTVTFTYRADDNDTVDNLSEPATVIIAGAPLGANCADPGVRCPLDDLTVFEFTECPGHFGGANLVCEQASTNVTFGSLPPELRGQVTVIDEVDPSDLEAGTRIFYFELPLPQAVAEDRAVVLPSRDSLLVLVTLPDGSFEVVRLGNAAPAVSNVEGTPRLVESSTMRVAVEEQTVAEVVVPTVAAVSGAADQQAVLGTVAGLDSTILVPATFERFTTLVYVSDDDELSSLIDPTARGFVIERPVGGGTPVNGSFESPLLPPAVLPIIEAAGGINPLQPIIGTQTVSQFPVTTIFPPDALDPALHAAEADGPAVAVGAGIGLSVPLAGLTPPPAVCPARPTGVRCNAGMQELLLATNQNGDVTRYAATDGASRGFFLGEFAPNFTISNGWKSLQAPDNCVVVSDQGIGLFLYNTTGARIATDGSGNAMNPGSVQPLIATTDVGARGFTFHSPDSDTHHLYVALPTQIVRYDYHLSGMSVLSNRTVLLTEPEARFNDIAIIDDLLYATDEAPDSTDAGVPSDLLRVYSLQGADLGILLSDLVTPYQIVELFDGNIGVVNFGTNEIRITNEAGDDLRRYLLDDGDAATFESPRGLYPLRNGSYQIAGRNGIGVSTLDRHSGVMNQRVGGNTLRFIGPACLP